MIDMAITVHTRHGHVAVTGGCIRYRVVDDHDATPLATVHGGPRPTHVTSSHRRPWPTIARPWVSHHASALNVARGFDIDGVFDPRHARSWP